MTVTITVSFSISSQVDRRANEAEAKPSPLPFAVTNEISSKNLSLSSKPLRDPNSVIVRDSVLEKVWSLIMLLLLSLCALFMLLSTDTSTDTDSDARMYDVDRSPEEWWVGCPVRPFSHAPARPLHLLSPRLRHSSDLCTGVIQYTRCVEFPTLRSRSSATNYHDHPWSTIGSQLVATQQTPRKAQVQHCGVRRAVAECMLSSPPARLNQGRLS